MTEALMIIFPMLFLVGSIILYHGIQKAKKLIFPHFREEFSLSAKEIKILGSRLEQPHKKVVESSHDNEK